LADQFGKYELQARIAAGGMAEIFKARFSAAPGVTKQVVIKRILPHYAANKAFIAMFTNEAKIAMGLSHGNIAQVFDFGEIEGDWYLAMELVDGQPLSKVMKRAHTLEIAVIPTAFAVLIGIEMLKGFHYAHTRFDEAGRPLKIVHRDVSPQNVLIGYEGQVKIVDFGIAKARTAGREETEAGAVKGKYAYFAPEQARGKELDARTDIFAAGIVMYEMLCGQLPFQGKMIEVLSKIVRGEFPRPRELNPDITPALERIILKAMAHEKADRYQTGEDFQQALSAYLYQNAPTFAPSGLGMFMGLLFEEELVAEGRPVQLPRDFLDQVSLWKGAMPAIPKKDPVEETRYARSPGARDNKRTMALPEDGAQEDSSTGAHFRANYPRWLRPMMFLAIPLVAALLTGIGVLAYGKWSTFSINLTSAPMGALVRVDGRANTQTTPVLLTDLPADKNYELEVSAPGMKRWLRIVEPQRGALVTLHAELEPDRVPDSLLEEPFDAGFAAVDEPVAAPVVTEVPTEAEYPVSSVTVVAKKHAFLVPPSKAARLRLDPKKTYRVWTEGKLSFGGYFDNIFITEAIYFLEGGPALQAKDSFGLVGPKGTIVKHATALYAFVADEKANDNSGAIKVRVMDMASHQTSTVLVDAKSNSFAPDQSTRFSVQRLEPTSSYDLRLREGKPKARSLGDKGGLTRKVLLKIEPGWNSVLSVRKSANDLQRILETGKTIRINGAMSFWVTIPDDGLDDNAGSFELEVSSVAGGGGLLNGLVPKGR